MNDTPPIKSIFSRQLYLASGVLILLAMAAWLVKESKQDKPGASHSADQAVTPEQSPLPSPVIYQGTGRLWLAAPASSAEEAPVLVDIFLDTGGKNITIARTVLEYDPAALEFVSFVKDKSDLDLVIKETQEPGQVLVSRGATGDTDPNDQDDGFTGSQGRLAQIMFKAQKPGATRLALVLAESRVFVDAIVGGQAPQLELELGSAEVMIK